MNRKHIKVAYTSRLSGGSYTQVPKIQMEGRWLEELGFSIGSTIVVEYEEGSLCIRPMTETELAEKQRREAQKELDSKAAEIRKPPIPAGKRRPGTPACSRATAGIHPHLRGLPKAPPLIPLTPPSACR